MESTPNLRVADTPALRAAIQIAETLHHGGHQVFFAGGCVRDLLLGLSPKDFDVATSATPEEVTALFPRTLQVGAVFGVVLVRSGDEGLTEVATFRHDGSYADGRRPDAVRFSADPQEDVQRRDFTINGMLLDPLALTPIPTELADQGASFTLPRNAIVDFVGGQQDLQRGVVRTIGEARLRFREDKLRMLRGIRFAARLGFTLDARTLDAIAFGAAEIDQVSQERVREELTRMLTEGHGRRAFELLDQTGLLERVLPEVSRMHGVAQPPDWHPEGDVWTHTMLLLEKLRAGCGTTLAWGALLHDVGKPATYRLDGARIRFNGHVEVGVRIGEEILQRLRFSNEETAQIVALIKNHMRFGDVPNMKESTLRRFLRLPAFQEHLELHWLDCSSCHGRLQIYEFTKSRFEDEPELDQRPALLVTGRDLIAAGYRPGPAFKGMLEAAEDAQLEGRVATAQEALQLIDRDFGNANNR